MLGFNVTQQSYDSIPLDLEDKIEGGDDEICDWEQDVRDVRGCI